MTWGPGTSWWSACARRCSPEQGQRYRCPRCGWYRRPAALGPCAGGARSLSRQPASLWGGGRFRGDLCPRTCRPCMFRHHDPCAPFPASPLPRGCRWHWVRGRGVSGEVGTCACAMAWVGHPEHQSHVCDGGWTGWVARLSNEHFLGGQVEGRLSCAHPHARVCVCARVRALAFTICISLELLICSPNW